MIWDKREDMAVAIAEARWQCKAHRIPGAGLEHPQYLFTREPSVEAIGVAHVRVAGLPLPQGGLELEPVLWERARFLGSALAFVVIVAAPDGLFFATIKDFDRDAVYHPARTNGIDSRARWVIPRAAFKELKPDGAKIGPGVRAA